MIKAEKLEWNVWNCDINTKEIEVVNVFDASAKFNKELNELKKEAIEKNYSFDEFSKQLEHAVMHCYWGKCEYEVLINGVFTSGSERKIDIYEQLKLNWNKFAKYVYENLRLIRKAN